MGTPISITTSELMARIGGDGSPPVLDVRRRAAFEADGHVLPTAVWREHAGAADWALARADRGEVVVYCAHGEQLSQGAVADMRAEGIAARHLEGGIDAWRAAGGVLVAKAGLGEGFETRPTRWITRARPKVDRTACPWLIRRFIDRDARFLFVEPAWVRDAAADFAALPYDIEDVEFTHVGDGCTFDTLIDRFGLADPALLRMAQVLRAADTGALDAEPQAPGVLALCLGLSAITDDDQAQVDRAMVLHDALYGWCRFAAAETHGWPPRG
jgi:rhodanese-related sulfurtransferase